MNRARKDAVGWLVVLGIGLAWLAWLAVAGTAFFAVVIVIGYAISYVWRVTGLRDLFDQHPWLNDAVPWAVIAVASYFAIREDHLKTKAAEQVRVLRELGEVVEALAVVKEDPERVGRAKIAVQRAIRRANDTGLLLEGLSDELVVSLNKLDQLEAAIASEIAAADRRRSSKQATVWGILGFGVGAVGIYLTIVHI
ncbi:hypothetical protein ACFXPR_26255 [Nocardia tengchongensis]|uniref:hypothetical protein n=1 Tax=Nocardia tengchongensis TaxID=2055889 RepID=UPI00369E71F6